MVDVVLENGSARARIALSGAELQEWSIGGTALLWDGDKRFWADRSPVLFPVVGWTRGAQMRVGQTIYPLKLHGFAKESVFDVVSSQRESVRLRLRDSDATRALYPFPFHFEITYRLGEEDLRVEIDVANTGTEPMPYATGLHPGFRWPLPGAEGAEHELVFEKAETPLVPVIAPGGLISDRLRPVPLSGRTMRMSHDLFSNDALCFVDATSRSVRFGAPNQPALRVDFENLQNIVLWSRGGAPFLCIEGWSGLGDPENFEGDIFEKPGMTVLQPGEAGRHAMRFTYGADA